MDASETHTREAPGAGNPDPPERTADCDLVAPAGRIGRFCVLRLVGTGGMGRVYAAYDPELDRRVAIKVLHRRSGDLEHGEQRLVREAQALARLSHPNVVGVHDVGVFRNRGFVAMEYVDGTTLAHWAARQRAESAPASDFLDVLIQAGNGLCAAHRAGIVHRDFKPSNVLIGRDGRVRVADFGLARGEAAERDEEAVVLWGGEAVNWPRGPLGEQITASGAVVGTPRYMAPEQLANRNIGPAADQFAFATVAWELLSGEAPFGSSDLDARSTAIRNARYQALITMPGISPRVIAALSKGLRFDAKRRHPGLDDLVRVLEEERQFLDGRPRRAQRASAIGVAVIGVTGVAVLLTRSPVEDACLSGDDAIAEVWNEHVAEELGGSLTASGVPFASTLWEDARRELDRFRDKWVEMYGEACRATLKGEQSAELLDLRMECLDMAKREMGATIEVLHTDDRDLLGKGWRLLPDAERIDRCGSREWLMSRGTKPAEPEVGDLVTGIREDIVRANMMISAGRTAEAREELRRLVSRAEATEFMPVLLESRLVEARMLAQVGELGPAEETARDVYRTALANQHLWLVSDAAALIAGVLNVKQEGLAEAEWFARLAVGTADALGDLDARAAARQTLAASLYVLGRYSEAVEQHEATLALLDRADVSEGKVIAVLIDMADALMSSGRLVEARKLMDDLEPRVAAAFGSIHPDAIEFVRNRAGVAFYQGQYVEATLWFRRAVEQSAVLLGREHPVYWMDRLNLAMVLEAQGAYEQALVEIDAVLEREIRVEGELHIRTAAAYQTKGNILFYQLRYDEAAELYSAALSGFIAEYGEAHRGVVQMLGNLGNCYFEKGDYKTAEAQHRRGLTLAERTFGFNHPATAHAHVNLGNALVGQQRWDDAAVEYKQAIEIHRVTDPSGSPQLASALERYGELLLERGEPRDAEPLLREALSIRRGTDDAPGYLGRSAVLVARALDDLGAESTEIPELLRMAMTNFDGAGQNYAALIEEADAWLRVGKRPRRVKSDQ